MQHVTLLLLRCSADGQRMAHEVSCQDVPRQELYLAVIYADGSPTFKPMITVINSRTVMFCSDVFAP